MEAVPGCQPPAKVDHVFTSELDDASASSAHHVVVGGLAETAFVMGLLNVEADLLEDAAADEEGEGSVDGGLGDAVTLLAEGEEQLLGFEVVGEVEDGVEDDFAGGGELDAAALEVAPEGVPSGLVDFVSGNTYHVCSVVARLKKPD